MKKVIKTEKGRIALAYELGCSSRRELELTAAGRIRALGDGHYEIFSRESVNGSGERAKEGDFFKEDHDGFPYPIEREYFLNNHRRIAGDLYEQSCRPLDAWTVEDGMCEEMDYLISHCGLVIDPSDDERYFSAPLFGTMESAARDAVIVFYTIRRSAEGLIVDARFNFVERGEFEQTYEWIDG